MPCTLTLDTVYSGIIEKLGTAGAALEKTKSFYGKPIVETAVLYRFKQLQRSAFRARQEIRHLCFSLKR